MSGYSSRPTALPGLNDGVGLRFCDGATVGVALGRPVGLRVTRMVGNRVGSGVGTKLVGSSVGVQLGYSVGAIVGVSVEYLNATQLSDLENRSSHSPTPTRQCTHTRAARSVDAYEALVDGETVGVREGMPVGVIVGHSEGTPVWVAAARTSGNAKARGLACRSTTCCKMVQRANGNDHCVGHWRARMRPLL